MKIDLGLFMVGVVVGVILIAAFSAASWVQLV